MALLPVGANPKWRPAAVFKNFEWPYLSNGLLDPLHVWFHRRVNYFCSRNTVEHANFWDGGAQQNLYAGRGQGHVTKILILHPVLISGTVNYRPLEWQGVSN